MTPPVNPLTQISQPYVSLDSLPGHWRSLTSAFVHQARANGARKAISDSRGQSLTFAETFLHACALAKTLSRKLGKSRYVGIMLPPTVPAALANLAVTFLGKVPVNLNYAGTLDIVNYQIKKAHITHVLTAEAVLGLLGTGVGAEIVLMEKVKDDVSTFDKIWAAVVAKVVPQAMLGLFLPGMNSRPTDTATLLFTSGSTGQPKAPVLSHRAIMSNIWQFKQHEGLTTDDVILGIAPMFHSLGFTVTLWAPLLLGFRAVYHPNPREGKKIGALMAEHGVTIVAVPPTFMRLFLLPKCTKEQFAAVRLLLVGAEKLKPELAADIKAKLDKEPVEAYGLTQMSPGVSANIPKTVRTPDGREVYGNKLGSVGILLPGTEIQFRDVETGAVLPLGQTGMIYLRGPQMMDGYFEDPESTAKVIKDGWLSTGDVGHLDQDASLTLDDRIERFAKPGGEMVPLGNVEAAIVRLAGVDESAVAATYLPDDKRTEKIVIVYTDLKMTPAEVCKRMNDDPAIPKIWIPSPSDFVQVDAIPMLATGKLDLQGLKRVAREKLG